MTRTVWNKKPRQSLFLGYKETIDSNQPTESKYIPEDSSQEPIFPPELILNNDLFQKKSLNFQVKKLIER